MIAAIVLSGGASVRMGTPKALLRFHGTDFLGAILDAASALNLVPRVVVLGHDARKVLAAHDLSGVTCVTSGDLEAGPIGSIRSGIEAVVNHPVEGALVWQVDQPHVQIETVRQLIDAFRAARAAIAVPQFGGRRGHPVVFSRAVFPELMAAPAPLGARAVVRRDPERVLTVAVDDPAVLEDIDTPEAYQQLLKRLDRVRE